MGLLDVHSEGIGAAFDRQLRNPGPAPAPASFSAWGVITSLGKAPIQGGLEQTGSILDFLSPFGATAAASGGTGQGMFSVPTADEKKQEDEARKRMLASDTFDASAGNELRRKAEEFAPNPQTTHAANQVVHGVIRGASKLVLDAATLGPVTGAAVFGADEGNTAAQKLIEQGVDPATAAKVGVTTGVVQGAAAAIPVVGSTIAKTIGLAAVGGPISYVAQEKATKEILQRANYGNLAATHDPLDPLGLALSVAIPGVVAGLHIRGLKKTPELADVVKHIESGGKRFDENGNLITSPKGAQGEMQVMPKTATDPGFGVVPAKDNSPDELARVGRDYLSAMQQKYGDTDKALAAYNAGPGAVDAAVKAHGGEWLAHLPDETQKYVAKANKLMGDHIAGKGAEDPAVVDAARVKVLDEAMARGLPDHPEAHAEVMRAVDEVAAGRTPVVPAHDQFPPLGWITGEDLIGKSYDELDALHAQAVEHNRAIDLEGIRRFWGDAQAKEAEGWSKRKRENWLAKEDTDESSDWMQQRYMNDELIAEHRSAVNDFDTENATALGESIAVRARKVDEPGFFSTPEGRAFSNALRYAKEQGWNLDDVMAGMRNRSAQWAGNDAPELFARLYQRATEPRPEIATPPPEPPPALAPPRESTTTSTLPPADRPTIKPETTKSAAKDDGAVDQARLKQLLEERPHLEETILRAHEQYDDDVSLADLVKVAAECALANGG